LFPVSNFITLGPDVVRMVEIFEIGSVTSWKSTRRSWMRHGAELEQYLRKLVK
jgi:hypothetical protein